MACESGALLSVVALSQVLSEQFESFDSDSYSPKVPTANPSLTILGGLQPFGPARLSLASNACLP